MGSEDAEENERSCNGMTSAMVETDRTGHGSAGSGGVEEAAETNVNSGAKDDAMKMSRAQKRKVRVVCVCVCVCACVRACVRV